MEMFVLVLSMWGKTAMGEWLYIGNQYAYNTPMPQEQCESLISRDAWSHNLTNEFYRIQLDCMPESSEIKEK
tara:strand:- start:682 stop:897 length:216 start_codon:yes stop_codon:yes gene_type:complete